MNETYKIVFYPSAILSKRAEEVSDFDSSLEEKIKRMRNTMYKNGGIGLAAPQVGISKRIIVIDVNPEKKTHDENYYKENPIRELNLINPVILSHSPETLDYEEGCLSLPGTSLKVTRFKEVTVSFFDEKMKKHEITASGILSICIQHEIDHINGLTLIDHADIREKEQMLQEIKKYKDSI